MNEARNGIFEKIGTREVFLSKCKFSSGSVIFAACSASNVIRGCVRHPSRSNAGRLGFPALTCTRRWIYQQFSSEKIYSARKFSYFSFDPVFDEFLPWFVKLQAF